MSRTLIDHDATHAVHEEASNFLWDLVLDLDFIRIGKPSRDRPLTVERLARWPALAARVRTCWLLRADAHAPELADADALVAAVRGDLEAGRTPVLPAGGFDAYRSIRQRLDRCRLPSKRN